MTRGSSWTEQQRRLCYAGSKALGRGSGRQSDVAHTAQHLSRACRGQGLTPLPITQKLRAPPVDRHGNYPHFAEEAAETRGGEWDVRRVLWNQTQWRTSRREGTRTLTATLPPERVQ